ncbi:ral guanine nucleotide dissociation stimulator-like [Apodemus sylvaticus]|uniref:ral guanine nucleotide dissociation stimulator-like n=1 Tax=Apodemus sylvaticus TaxID=10129 RepID=UPI002242DAF4|nr:ral guanine nucleotide dissociation stimulator-like [Apodemus sylvaticus]
MFSCLPRTPRGSSLKNDKTEGHGSIWRHRVHSCLQRLWPFSRKGKILTKVSQDRDSSDQGEKASASMDLQEHHRVSRVSAETVVKLVNNLVPSLQEGDPFFVHAFLSKYRSFATPLQVLDLLFMRYANFSPYSEEDEQVKNTLCSFLHTWMDKNPEDFCDPLDLFPLKYVKAYLSVYMPHSDLIDHVSMLLTQLQQEQVKHSEEKEEED